MIDEKKIYNFPLKSHLKRINCNNKCISLNKGFKITSPYFIENPQENIPIKNQWKTTILIQS